MTGSVKKRLNLPKKNGKRKEYYWLRGNRLNAIKSQKKKKRNTDKKINEPR